MKKILTILAIAIVFAAITLYIKTNFQKENENISGTMVKEIRYEYYKQRI